MNRWVVSFSLSLISALALGSPFGTEGILRYRLVNEDACTVVVSDPTVSQQEDIWETTIDNHMIRIRDRILILRQKTPHGLQRLRKAKSKLRRTARYPELISLFPYADLLDEKTHKRWEWMREKHAITFQTLTLKDIFRLGHASEFAMTVFDSKTRALRLNLNFGFDAWLESIRSTDVADPDTIAVYSIAEAYFQLRTGQSPDFLVPGKVFIAFALYQLSKHKDIVEKYHFEIPDREARENELISQLWTFFKQRFALTEALRFYEKVRQTNEEAFSLQYGQYLSQTEAKREENMRAHLAGAYFLDPEIVDRFWTVDFNESMWPSDD